jgi:hypothetical protein
MPYALIPEGFTLKKVTKLQEDAVKEHRRHEDVKTFLNNETTPLLLGGALAVTLTPILWGVFLKLLTDQGVNLTEEQRQGLSTGLLATNPLGLSMLAFQKVLKVDKKTIADWQKALTTFTTIDPTK